MYTLLRQMAGFTGHPDLKKKTEEFRLRMHELDKGRESEVEALKDHVTRLDMGLTPGEMRRIRKRCTGRPGWKWHPNKMMIVSQIDARLKPGRRAQAQ